MFIVQPDHTWNSLCPRICPKPADSGCSPGLKPCPGAEDYIAPRHVWEDIWPQLPKRENKKSVHLHSLLPIMHRAQTRFARIYYPINIFPMHSMVYCCVWSWLGTPYALWDGGQVQVATSMPSSPEVSAMEYLLKEPGVHKQLISQLPFPFSLNQTVWGKKNPP